MTAKPGTADCLGQPSHNRLLDCDSGRPRAPRGYILIKDASQQISHSTDWLSRTENVTKEAAILHAREPNDFRQGVQGVFANAGFRHRRPEQAKSLFAVRRGRDREPIDVIEIFRCDLSGPIGQAAELASGDFNWIHDVSRRPQEKLYAWQPAWEPNLFDLARAPGSVAPRAPRLDARNSSSRKSWRRARLFCWFHRSIHFLDCDGPPCTELDRLILKTGRSSPARRHHFGSSAEGRVASPSCESHSPLCRSGAPHWAEWLIPENIC